MFFSISELNLGNSILSISLLIGFFLLFVTIIRSIEIPIRIYLDKKRTKIKDTSKVIDVTKAKEAKSFLKK